MTANQKLNYLSESQSFRVICDLIGNLIGAKLQLHAFDGEVIDCCIHNESSLTAPSLGKIPALHQNCQFRSPSCAQNMNEAVNRLRINQEPVRIECQAGKRRLIMPVIIEGELVGVAKFVENENFRLNNIQMNTVINLLKTTFDNFNRNELSFVLDYQGQDMTHQQKIIRRVVNYINTNYQASDLSLSDVSRQCGISYHYLSRLFKTELKKNFSNYLCRLRMDVALRLLQDRSLTISQIALSCGFEDAGYFCKVFKKIHGQSPLTYRKSHVANVRSKLSHRLRKELV